MTDEQQAARGQRATLELRETESAFAAVEAALVKTLTETSPGQPEKILKLHAAIQNLAAVKQALMNVIQAGQVAENAIAMARLTQP